MLEKGYPEWFFPADFSMEANDLLAEMLEPDPSLRIGVDDARTHEWLSRFTNNRSKKRGSVPSPFTSDLAQKPALRGEWDPTDETIKSSAGIWAGPASEAT